MSSLNFKYCSKAYLLEVVRQAGVLPVDQAQQMKLPDLRAQLTALIQSHAAELAGAVASVDAMVRDGVVLKTRRGRSRDSDALESAEEAVQRVSPAPAPSTGAKNSTAGELKVIRVQRGDAGVRGRRREGTPEKISAKKGEQSAVPGAALPETAAETPAERPDRIRRSHQQRRRSGEADGPAASASGQETVDAVSSPDLPADAADGCAERGAASGQPAFRGDRRGGFRNERRGSFRQRSADRREPADESDQRAAQHAAPQPAEAAGPISDELHSTRQLTGTERDTAPEHRRDWAETPETGDAPADPGDPARTGRRPAVEQEVRGGVLELMPDGYGFLRAENYAQSNHDIYIPPQFIRRFNLRQGDYITGPCRSRRENDRYQALAYIYTVNGAPPEQTTRRPHFERLTPIYPDCRFNLETVKGEFATRIIDLIAPIGKGQRGMIVSPPKAGKTILLQKIANAITVNNPEVHLIVLLIDERPEEVTDMQRSINGEVVYSTFDKTPENHVAICEMVLERAMRIVELGKDVVILLDSITRLARAYNLTINPTGRTLSGGLDPGALYGPKRFFGAARNIENGGSLTIVATALIDTGSRMDEVIFEEFKGTGNMEVYLDRKLSEKRIFPAIDIGRSGTRREDLLLSKDELDAIWAIRKAFANMDAGAVTETVINLLTRTNNNHHFVSSINVSLNDKALHDTMNPKRQLGGSGTGSNSSGSGAAGGRY